MFVASLIGCLIGLVRMDYFKLRPQFPSATPITQLTNPPPIGSVQAEFQNDYIPVFPMYNVKNRIDLDYNQDVEMKCNYIST